MAEDPEALAQMARLLGAEGLPLASAEDVRAAAEERWDRLLEGLLAEAAASDDVSDRRSALDFLAERLRFLGPLLSEDQRERLWSALVARVDAW